MLQNQTNSFAGFELHRRPDAGVATCRVRCLCEDTVYQHHTRHSPKPGTSATRGFSMIRSVPAKLTLVTFGQIDSLSLRQHRRQWRSRFAECCFNQSCLLQIAVLERAVVLIQRLLNTLSVCLEQRYIQLGIQFLQLRTDTCLPQSCSPEVYIV